MINLLKNKFLSISLMLLAITIASCSNDENIGDMNRQSADVIVTTMGAFSASTRVSDNQQSMPVLQFRDEATYAAIIRNLKDMTNEDKIEYFNQLGFNGAYTLINEADCELDSIFDIEDRESFELALSQYKGKYSEMFAFNQNDEYDASPYLIFTDEEKALVGNIHGFVAIGDRLLAPSEQHPTYDIDVDEVDDENIATRAEAPGPIEPGFKAFKDASLSIKNGKYRSTMTIGRIVNGNSFCVEFITKKKQFLWKKKVNTSHSAVLEMSSPIFHHTNTVFCPSGARWSILNLPIEAVGNVFNANVTQFKCGKGNAEGSASFTNIQVI